MRLFPPGESLASIGPTVSSLTAPTLGRDGVLPDFQAIGPLLEQAYTIPQFMEVAKRLDYRT